MGKIGSSKGASRSSSSKSTKSSASKKSQTSKNQQPKEAEKTKETEKSKETKNSEQTKLSDDAKKEDMRTVYGFTPPNQTEPKPTEPSTGQTSTGQGSNAINDKLDDILKALQDAMKPKEAEKGKECGGGGGEGGGGEGGGGDKAKDAGSAGGPQMNPNQGKQDWDMIINADCDRVIQAAGMGCMMGQQGMQGMPGAGGVQGAGGIGGGMNPAMGGVMGMTGMGGGNLTQAKQQLQKDLQSAQGQGWQPQTPQLKQKLQMAMQAGGDMMGQQQGMPGMGVMTPGQAVPVMGPGRMI